MRSALPVCICITLSIFPVAAHAAPVVVNGSSGPLSASAKFETSGTNLIVTLTNTSTADVLKPVDVLTGLFFDLAGNPSLSRTSALIAPGSEVYEDNVNISP